MNEQKHTPEELVRFASEVRDAVNAAGLSYELAEVVCNDIAKLNKLERERNALLAALKYAKRFLTQKTVDMKYIDETIASIEGTNKTGEGK